MVRVPLLMLTMLLASCWYAASAELTEEELYQQARAHFGRDEYTEALRLCDQLLDDDLSSPWRDKAVFLKADAHAKLKQYNEAAAIYEQQANRLLSPQRRDEVAHVFLRFARAVADTRGEQAPDAIPPDYGKALRLYEAALKLDVSEELREEILFLRAETQRHAEEWTAAIRMYQEYLQRFDPTWQSGTATERRTVTGVADPSRLYRARLSLAICQLASGEHVQARTALEDLLRRLDAPKTEQAADTDAIRRDAAYQFIRTHRFPQRLSEQDFHLGLTAAQDFLKEYPADPRSVELAYQVALSYERHGRTDDAIAAYRTFIAREGSAIPDQPLPDGEFPQAVYERLRMEATYQIASLLFGQRRFEAAAETWRQYTKQFPDGPRWTDAQRQIVDTEFQIGLAHLNRGEYDQMKETWDAFLEAHPLDPRCPQIMFTYGQMHLIPISEDELGSPESEDLTQAITIWERLIQKHPGTAEASLALFRVGEIYEQRLGQMEKALETYRRLTWGEWAQHARSRVAEMTQKRLRVLTERTYRTNETPLVRVKTRNIEKLSVRIYPLDLESYWRRYHNLMDVEQLDIGLIEPDQQWEYHVPDYARYLPLDNSIEIPMDGPGACLVHLSDDDFEATTLVLRSDLDAIVKSSRREVFVFVQEMLGMHPADQAHVLVTDGGKLIAEGTTNADGIYQQQLPMVTDTKEIGVFVSRQGHGASNTLDMRKVRVAEHLRPRGYVYTDRPAYRPSQTVNIRGIVHGVRDGSHAVAAGAPHTLTVLDAGGRVLHTEQVSLSEFGTFHTQVVLDSDSPTGEYRMRVQPEQDNATVVTGAFIVERFRLEKVHLDMEFSQPLYFRGETVEGTLTASYYHGGAVRHKPLRIQFPDGRTLIQDADETGKVAFTFDTTHYQSGTYLVFRADLTAENVAVEAKVLLAALGFSTHIKPPADAPLVGKPFDVVVETRTPDAKPIGKQLTLTVLRIKPSEHTSLLDQIPWFSVPQQMAETEVCDYFLTTHPETGRATQTLTLAESGTYRLRVAGMDRFGQMVFASTELQAMSDRDGADLKLVTESLHLAVGDAPKFHIHSRLGPLLALMTVETEGVLSYRLLHLQPGETSVPFMVEHDHYPNFRIGVSAIGVQPHESEDTPLIAESDPLWMQPSPPKLYVDTTHFTVERELKVRVRPEKEVYRPGEEALIHIQTLDQQDRPVRSELSLALVDEALFALFAEGRSLTDFVREAVLHRPGGRTASTCGFYYRPMVQSTVKEWAEESQRLHQQAEAGKQAKASLLRIVEPDTGKRFGVMVFNDEIVSMEDLRARLGSLPSEGRYLLLIEVRENVPPEQIILVREMAQQAGVNNVEYALPGTRIADLPKPRRPVVRPIGKPVTATEGFDVLKKGMSQVQPRMTTAAVVRPANVRAATVLEFSNQQIKITPPVGDQGGMAVRDESLSASIWIPALVTDSAGEAEVRFTMPQRTTRWRLTARGCTPDALLGENQASVVTRTDFFLGLKLPSTLVEGDQVRPLVQVHNLTSTAGRALLQLRWRNGPEEGKAEQQVAISAQGTTQAIFEAITASVPGEIQIEVTVASREDAELKDALVEAIPVHPWGRELTRTRRGVATGDVNLSMQLPTELELRNRKLTIRIAPEVERLVLDRALGTGMHGLDSQTAQVASQLLGVAHALEYAQTVTLPTTDVSVLVQRAQSLVSALVVRQRTDGGWAWCPGASEADSTITARCLWALAEIRQQSVSVPQEVVQNAMNHLQTVLPKNTDEETRPLLLYALSRVGIEDLDSANRLYRNRNSLSRRALAMTALCFIQWERHPVALELIDLMMSHGDAGTLNTETAALAILVLTSAQPESAVLPDLVAQVFSQPKHHTASVAAGLTTAALAAYYRQSQSVTNDYRLTISVNSKVLKELRVQRGQELFTLETEDVLEGTNSVSLATQGRARYAYEITLSGFASDFPSGTQTPGTLAADTHHSTFRRLYYHLPLEYDGRPIAQSTSVITQLEHGGRTSVRLRIPRAGLGQAAIIEEPLPSGAMLIPDSVEGSFHHYEVTGTGLRFYYGQSRQPRGPLQPAGTRLPGALRVETIRYELGGYVPGVYRVPPTSLRAASDPDVMLFGQETTLSVLSPGETSTDEYVMNDEERFGLAKALFRDGRHEEALALLTDLHERSPSYEQREVTRMLFWIRTEEGHHDARQIVEAFELLHELSPELILPFDRVLAVQRAYQEIGESERAYRLLRTVLNASYANESHVSATLEDEGQLLNAMDFQEALWQSYPDTESIVASYFGLSQALIAASEAAASSPFPPRLPLLETRNEGASVRAEPWLQPVMLLQRAAHLMLRFLNLYPTDPLADDAAFSLANAYLDLDVYPQSIELCRAAQAAYPKSPHQTGYQYLQALGFFWQHEFEAATEAALTVALGESDDRQLAQYILGQIHHAQGNVEEAIRWYRKVQDLYPDARECIDQFERRVLSLPQAVSYSPGEPVTLTLTYRNIREADVQLYRVDLMRFYLREKNLRDLSQIRLAGIEPIWSQLSPLGDGKDYAEKQRTLPLEIQEEGAYLVVCRGDDLFASSIILVTPLAMEVQPDGSGRVRVSLSNAMEENYPAGVHVKVIGSGNSRFVSGETDLRGIFAADGIRGLPTVVARDSQNRYAFYRGDGSLGASTNRSGNKEKQGRYQPSQADYRKNLQQRNTQIRDAGIRQLRELQRETQGILIGQ